ncbi:MAG: adenylyltransferase/cytidyltransferase family protein [Candidatus Kerfeldbacteria bacterium]
MSREVTVLAFGTFDLLHKGHRSFLRQAKRLGTRLVVVVGRDSTVLKLKRRNPVHSETERLTAVRKNAFVDRAVLALKDPANRFALIKRLKPNVIALGYDQCHYTKNLARDLKKHGIRCTVVRLKPFIPSRYKSSLLRKTLARKRKP